MLLAIDDKRRQVRGIQQSKIWFNVRLKWINPSRLIFLLNTNSFKPQLSPDNQEYDKLEHRRRSQAWRRRCIIRDCMQGCKDSNSSLDVFKVVSVDVAIQQNTTAQSRLDSTNDRSITASHLREYRCASCDEILICN